MGTSNFMCGVVEGFYGQPWNARQRHKLFTWMKAWGLNTYLYAPKDDLKHRARWRELYNETETAEIAALIRDCHRHGLQFIYALAPGLNLRYAHAKDSAALQGKFEQILDVGCRDFALLFDDIPPEMSAEDAQRFSSFAAAQGHVANELFRFVRAQAANARFLFCPTEYCGRMAQPSVRESSYLRELGELLLPEMDILWTGPEIISETISVESIRELAIVLKRPPLIWDNLHANDYDMRRLYLGPYSGRPLELRADVKGILSNPNCEFEANFVPLRTLAMFAQAQSKWEPRSAYRAALNEWLSAFKIQGRDCLTVEDLELLCDCFYLPHEFGDGTKSLLADLKSVLRAAPSDRLAILQRLEANYVRFMNVLVRLPELDNRELLYAGYRRFWELKEELNLLRKYLTWLALKHSPDEVFVSPEHRRKIYRGGLVAELQQLLPMNEAGGFHHRVLNQ